MFLQKCLFPKLLWPTATVRKKNLVICKIFIPKSEKKEQFLKPNAFLACS